MLNILNNGEFIKNKNSLLNYFNICCVEKIGVHTLNTYDKNYKILDKNLKIFLINFIDNYIKYELLNNINNYSIFIYNYLFLKKFKDNLHIAEIHQTRDCQIFETGRHIINLSFKLKQNNEIYEIVFTKTYKYDFKNLLTNDNIYLKFIIEKEYENDLHNDLDNNLNNNLLKKNYNINLLLFNNLNLDFMFEDEKIIKPDLVPDACIVS